MASDLSRYSRMEASAVHEMANIGLGHAMTALSILTGQSFRMTVPRISTVSLESVPEMIGGKDKLAVGVYMAIAGDISGHLACIFPWESAQNLWGMLLDNVPSDMNDVDELASSAMLETGNIINSSFMDALSDMTGLSIQATPPLLSVDQCYSIVGSIVAEAEQSEVVALAIETRIFDSKQGDTEGFFLCIPTKSSLDVLLKSL
ncbi:MAG: chemotaxis protein CheC, partial [Armatimonadetes bacterium]|nr:chemotaxis protein CheC [Armatimonadota bacterium]